jgi:TonB family protein
VRWTIFLGALAAACPAAVASAAKPIEDGWAAYATNDEFAAARPKALPPGGFARGVIRCAVEDGGELSKCAVVRETPQGVGVGAAVLSLAPKFRREKPGPKDLREVELALDWFEFDKAGDWVRRPSADDLRTVLPGEAIKRGISGLAVIDCVATVQGALTDCVVVHEAPAGIGFGASAIALTPQFMMRPASLKGVPVRSTVRMPIRFVLGSPATLVGSKRVVPPGLAWADAPTYADVAAAYPTKARAERLAGRATVACDMSDDGRLKGCVTVSSEPRGYGFDVAAKNLAKRFRHEIRSESDRVASRRVSVHLPFTFDPAMLDKAEPVIGKPSWAALPEEGVILSTFKATKATSTVRVQLKCVVRPGGALADCAVVSEQPAGLGVGAAALSLAPAFRVTTWTAEGLPTVGGALVIPLRYEPGSAAPPSPPPAGH